MAWGLGLFRVGCYGGDACFTRVKKAGLHSLYMDFVRASGLGFLATGCGI